MFLGAVCPIPPDSLRLGWFGIDQQTYWRILCGNLSHWRMMAMPRMNPDLRQIAMARCSFAFIGAPSSPNRKNTLLCLACLRWVLSFSAANCKRNANKPPLHRLGLAFGEQHKNGKSHHHSVVVGELWMPAFACRPNQKGPALCGD